MERTPGRRRRCVGGSGPAGHRHHLRSVAGRGCARGHKDRGELRRVHRRGRLRRTRRRGPGGERVWCRQAGGALQSHRRHADPLLDRLRFFRRCCGAVPGRRRQGAAERLRAHQAGGRRAAGQERLRLPPDPHQLAVRPVGQQLRAHDGAADRQARRDEGGRRPAWTPDERRAPGGVQQGDRRTRAERRLPRDRRRRMHLARLRGGDRPAGRPYLRHRALHDRGVPPPGPTPGLQRAGAGKNRGPRRADAALER